MQPWLTLTTPWSATVYWFWWMNSPLSLIRTAHFLATGRRPRAARHFATTSARIRPRVDNGDGVPVPRSTAGCSDPTVGVRAGVSCGPGDVNRAAVDGNSRPEVRLGPAVN